MRDHYLIHGTNAMKGALKYTVGDGIKYDKRSVGLFMSIACTSLTYMLEDKVTLEQIAAGISQSHESNYHYFRDFVEEFVKPDKALMIAAGMDDSMAKYLFADLQNIRKVLRDMESIKDSKIDIDWLRGRIQELQYSACSQESINKQGLNGISPVFRRIINLLGGGSIVTTNVLADAVIGGVASAFSQGYGGHLVMKGLD